MTSRNQASRHQENFRATQQGERPALRWWLFTSPVPRSHRATVNFRHVGHCSPGVPDLSGSFAPCAGSVLPTQSYYLCFVEPPKPAPNRLGPRPADGRGDCGVCGGVPFGWPPKNPRPAWAIFSAFSWSRGIGIAASAPALSHFRHRFLIGGLCRRVYLAVFQRFWTLR